LKNSSVEMWRRAEKLLDEARDLYDSYDYPGCICRAQECVELTLKAIFGIFGKEYPKKHDVSEELARICNKFPAWFYEKLAKIKVSSKLLAWWRKLALYGDEDLKLPPERIFGEVEAKLALVHAEEISSAFMRLLIEQKGNV